jgi:hypothetical protein
VPWYTAAAASVGKVVAPVLNSASISDEELP